MIPPSWTCPTLFGSSSRMSRIKNKTQLEVTPSKKKHPAVNRCKPNHSSTNQLINNKINTKPPIFDHSVRFGNIQSLDQSSYHHELPDEFKASPGNDLGTCSWGRWWWDEKLDQLPPSGDEISVEPKNPSVEKEIHIPNLHFWVPCLFSRV